MELNQLNVRNLLFVTSNTLRLIFSCKDYPWGAEYCLLVPSCARATPSRVYPELTADDQMFAYELAVVPVLSKALNGDMPSPTQQHRQNSFQPGESLNHQLVLSFRPDAISRRYIVKADRSHFYLCAKKSGILDVIKVIRRDSANAFVEILGQAQAVCSRIDWLRVGEVREAVMSFTHSQMSEI